MKLWLSGGELVVNAQNTLLLCNECPCEPGGCAPVSLNAVLTGSSTSEGTSGGYIYYNPIKQMVTYPSAPAPFLIEELDLLIAYLYCRTSSGAANEWEQVTSGWTTLWQGHQTPSAGGTDVHWMVAYRLGIDDTVGGGGSGHDLTDYQFRVLHNANQSYIVHGLHFKCASAPTLLTENNGNSTTATALGLTVPQIDGDVFQLCMIPTPFGVRTIGPSSGGPTPREDIHGVLGGSSVCRPAVFTAPGIGATGNVTNAITPSADPWKSLMMFIAPTG